MRFMKNPLVAVLFFTASLFGINNAHSFCSTPDLHGVLEIESCTYVETTKARYVKPECSKVDPKMSMTQGEQCEQEVKLDPKQVGIVLKGKWTSKSLVMDRQTKREPFLRQGSQHTKKRYQDMPKEFSTVVYIHADTRSECKKFKTGTSIEETMYSYCCESGHEKKSPCALGLRYYMEPAQK